MEAFDVEDGAGAFVRWAIEFTIDQEKAALRYASQLEDEGL